MWKEAADAWWVLSTEQPGDRDHPDQGFYLTVTLSLRWKKWRDGNSTSCRLVNTLISISMYLFARPASYQLGAAGRCEVWGVWSPVCSWWPPWPVCVLCRLLWLFVSLPCAVHCVSGNVSLVSHRVRCHKGESLQTRVWEPGRQTRAEPGPVPTLCLSARNDNTAKICWLYLSCE